MKFLLSILLLLLSVSLNTMAQEKGNSVNEVSAWLKESGDMIKNQKFDEAEILLNQAENSDVSQALMQNIRFFRMSLCFHKGMYSYFHLDYEEAARQATDGLSYYIGSNAKPSSWVNLCKLLGDCAFALGDYGSAREIYIMVRDHVETLDMRDHYAQSLMWIAKVDEKLGNYESSIDGFTRSYNILYELRSTKTPQAASSLARLYDHHLYNTEKALLWKEREVKAKSFFTEKKTSRFEVSDRFSFLTLATLKDTTTQIFYAGKKDEAIEKVSAWIRGAEEHGNDSVLLAEAYSWRASFELLTNKSSFCLKDLNHALSLVNPHKDNNRDLLYRIWNDIARCFYHSNKYEDARKANKLAILNANIVYGHNSIEMANLFQSKVNYDWSLKDYDAQIEDFCAANSIMKILVKKNFSFLDSQERASYWRRLSTSTFHFPHRIMEYGKTNDHYSDSLYQHLLFSKGLLLNTDIAERVSPDRDMSFLDITIDDVKDRLSDKSVAIEFCESVDVLDTTLCAVILDKNREHANLVPLCHPSELVSDLYSPDNLYAKIWQPIKSFIENKETVFFSPAGILNVLPIESSTVVNCKMYRVSSTRVLAEDTKQECCKSAVLYGGLQYDMPIDELIEKERKYTACHLHRLFNRNLRESMNGIPYLPGTEKEVRQIAHQIHKSDIISAIYSSADGTESSFKSLDKNSPSFIHIATHGYAVPYYQDHSVDAIFNRIARGNEDVIQEFERMNNCGLLFAGVQNVYDGIPIPDHIDDGVLTAQEISTLDLSGLNLVTLSACETAKGDITGDGVFGLQRGFKKAGANSIIMSLWKVDDEATCKLMTEFYSNWLEENMSKYLALEAAKKTIRETEGWEDPKYWASFILLDGLD